MRIVIWFLVILVAVIGVLAFVALYPPARDKALVAMSHAASYPYEEDVREISYGPLARHRLDYYPANSAELDQKRPIIMFYYGGAWRAGEKAFYHFVGTRLAAAGYDVVIPDYRLFPEVQFEGFMEDARLAYGWVLAEMAQAEGREVIVMGHSAGAHIAALMAYGADYRPKEAPRPAAFVGLAGPYAFDPKDWPSTKEIFADVPEADLARPVYFVDDQSPPSLMFHGDRDDVVKLWNQEELAGALAQHDVAHESVVLPETGHYKILFSFSRPLSAEMGVMAKIDGFINQHISRVK